MLNTFPNLLTYGFFTPTILRIVVALVLFYLAYRQWQRREEIGRVRHKAFPALSIVFNMLIGIALFIGYRTQIASLLAIAGFIIGLWLNKRYPNIRILPTTTVLVLIAVCLSLLLSGAGALAMDLPL